MGGPAQGRQRSPVARRIWTVRALVAVAALGTVACSLAQAAEPNADGEGEPRVPLQIQYLEELSFGRVVSDFGGHGAVVVDPDSNRKLIRGGAIDLGGHHGRGVIRVMGEPSAQFVITLPAEVKLSGKRGSTVVTDLTASPTLIGQIGPDGTALVYIGATMRMRAGQPSGGYKGKFDIFVDYR